MYSDYYITRLDAPRTWLYDRINNADPELIYFERCFNQTLSIKKDNLKV